MIVRDEVDLAAGFIDAVRGLWDELVVIDTGSADATPQLFHAAGARVYPFAWTHSFADARNASLERVTGEWVLVLDADERVSPEFVREFRAASQRSDLGAIWVHMSNPLPYGHRRESWLLRAFRHDASIRSAYPIHEDASATIEAMLRRTQLRLGHVQAPIEHLGYVRTRAAAKQKKQRDQQLLEASIQADARDFYSRLKLLELARYWGDPGLWQRGATSALDVLTMAPADVLTQAPWAGELISLIAEGLFRADNSVSLVLLDAWEARVPPSAAFFHRRAQVHEALGHLELAQRDFERCLTLGDRLGDRQLTTVRPSLGLSRLEILRGNLPSAKAHALRALADNGRDPEALTAVAALTRHLEGANGLQEWVDAHRQQLPHCPERDWAVGEALYAFGEYPQAVALLRQAAGVPPSGSPAVRLAQALLAEGSFDASEALARQLMAQTPEAGLGVLVFDLSTGRDSDLELDISPTGAEGAMRHWVDALLATRNDTWIRRFTTNARAVESLFPWLPVHLQRRTG
jgi:tetratricopeptide (TPR) repeat protein